MYIREGDPSEIKTAIDYISNNLTLDEDMSFISTPKNEQDIISRDEDEISHTLYLVGEKGEMLFCYVEMFSIYQYIVILNEDYQGEDISNKYSFDVLKQEEITDDKEIELEINSSTWAKMRKEYSKLVCYKVR